MAYWWPCIKNLLVTVYGLLMAVYKKLIGDSV